MKLLASSEFTIELPIWVEAIQLPELLSDKATRSAHLLAALVLKRVLALNP
jgi:hypothetical protein